MRLEFLGLAEKIISLNNNKPIVYYSNSGNWGDALIRAGAIAFFNHFNIKYQEIPSNANSLLCNTLFLKAKINNQLIVLAGSGAWCSHYSHMVRAARNIMNRYKFKNMLVLPTTYDSQYDITGITFYRRDNFESKANMPQSNFCHDMAFFLDPKIAKQPNKEVGNIFRTDIESNGIISIPEDNYDISIKGTETDSVYEFFDYISKYKVVNTDRLHASIAASILGRKVNLYVGSYFKNKAIYKSSLNEYFPNTNLIEV